VAAWAALAGARQRWQVTSGTGRGLAGDGRSRPGLARGDGLQARLSGRSGARLAGSVVDGLAAQEGSTGRGQAALAGARRGRPGLAGVGQRSRHRSVVGDVWREEAAGDGIRRSAAGSGGRWRDPVATHLVFVGVRRRRRRRLASGSGGRCSQERSERRER
jgi:hypothetical protein